MGEGFKGRRIFIIINQKAGGGRAEKWWHSALSFLDQQGLDYFWRYSAGGSATAAQVKQAVLEEQATAVLAVGGDGHIHDVVNGLIVEDKLIRENVALGIFPAGSGCDFARNIYNNKEDYSDDGFLDLLQNGHILPIDVGRADYFSADNQERRTYFINGCDIGLGAETAFRVNAKGGYLKRLLRNGQLAFFVAAMQALFNYRYIPIYIEADGEILNGNYLIAAGGNGRFMGGKMCLFPEAKINDGFLEMFLVQQMPIIRVLRLFAKVYDGSVLEVTQVCHRRVQSLSIKSANPLRLELDGELPGVTPLVVNILPGILPLLTFG
ncbi:MAG: diacylglycerol kinase family lipid kinase [Clostridiales bacterium]|nr:diacylglycerol kinase family lipid kinase [Clostridiales bacterium]